MAMAFAHRDFTVLDEAPFGAGGLTTRRLRFDKNGLQLILQRDPAAPVVAYRTWLGVGSSVETRGKTGLAHLFEHLLFKGTTRHPDGDFDRLIESAGGHNNAQTWFDFTAYQIDLPASSLELAVELESDRLANLVLAEDEVRSELEVVKNERRMAVDNDVDGFLEEELYKLAFTRHAYGCPTIGFMPDLEGLAIDDVRGFYRRYYAPDRATVVVVGDMDEHTVCDLVAHRYGSLPAAGVEAARPLVHEPAVSSERRVDFTRPCASDRLRMGWHAPPLGQDEHTRLEVLTDALFGGASSRVVRRLVVEEQIAVEVWAHVVPTREPGLLEVCASLQRSHGANEAVRIIDEEIARVARDGLKDAEVEKAQNRLEARLYLGLRDVGSRADSLGLYHVVAGDYRHLLQTGEAYRRVSAADCQRLAATLTPSARAVTVAHPSGDEDHDDEDHDDEGPDEGDAGDEGGVL
jgi:zinc protease